ncbi:MAG: adenylyltransferase/cytidyltransferase family protein [bacterium]
MQRQRIALFIGRFQPLHKGHLYAMRKALGVAKEMIIGIGSSQEEGTENNPWSYQVRKKMVEVSGEEMGIKEKVRGIWPVPDYSRDEDWTEYILGELRKAGLKIEEVVVVSNNEWTTRVLKEAGMKIYEQGFDNREEWEGYKIREIMRKGEKGWQGRVPDSVRKIMEKDPLV